MSGSRPAIRARWRTVMAVALACPLIAGLAGCAGTPLGESLSGSFPAPQASPPAQPEAAGPTAVAPAPTTPSTVEGSSRPARPLQGDNRSPLSPSSASGQASPQGRPAGKTPAPKPKPSSPDGTVKASAPSASPYRIILRLPQADPSAPAEAVTQALRAAAIPFEVETIERVQATAPQPAPPTSRPAPPPP
jgi:hypothetical protein